jgi:hypothetical protein
MRRSIVKILANTVVRNNNYRAEGVNVSEYFLRDSRHFEVNAFSFSYSGSA